MRTARLNNCMDCPGRQNWTRGGITLLELLIILAVVAAVFLIALPTLQPTAREASVGFAKQQLTYLAGKEQEYFLRYGTYAPLSKIAQDESIGRDFDTRFAEDEVEVNGIKFKGPTAEAKIFDIIAELPDGAAYRVDQSGEIRAFK